MTRRSIVPAEVRAVPRAYLQCKRGKRHYFPVDDIRKYRYTNGVTRSVKVVERCGLCGTRRIATYLEDSWERDGQPYQYKWPEDYRTADLGRVESSVWTAALMESVPWTQAAFDFDTI